MIWPIRDSLFNHAYSSSNWFKPKNFQWGFNSPPKDFIFLTDRNVHQADQFQCKKYAWLLESQAVTPNEHRFVENNIDKFDLIFTHSSSLIHKTDKALLVPPGGCHLEELDIHLRHEKTKLCSMMYSYKNFAAGHGLRFEVAKSFGHLVDCMGSGNGGTHIPKIEVCKPYKFQVVIENFSDGAYFTEKIIDCFLSGTIPIYWGCPNIGEFFNRDGFLIFNTIMDLNNIFSLDLESFWKDRQKEVEQNFEFALEYKVAEDYIWNKYRHLL